MNTIYATCANGLKGACTVEVLTALVALVPEYFTVTPFVDRFWEGNKEEARFGAIHLDDKLWHLDSNSFDQDLQKRVRTDPRVIEIFEKFGNGKHTVVDIPDDVVWEVWSWEYGEESIHEKHRSWT